MCIQIMMKIKYFRFSKNTNKIHKLKISKNTKILQNLKKILYIHIIIYERILT